jgi:hypothetical protein
MPAVADLIGGVAERGEQLGGEGGHTRGGRQHTPRSSRAADIGVRV